MLKNKHIKILLSSFLVLVALWLATPKVFIHQLLHHSTTETTNGSETKVKSQSTDNCDFDKYNKPTYFSIFKFIFSFLPVKPKNADKVADEMQKLTSFSYAISLLRDQPVSE